MALKKSKKAVRAAGRKGGKSRGRSLVILVLAAIAAAVVYQYMAPTGAFKPVPVPRKASKSSPVSVNPSSGAAETRKLESAAETRTADEKKVEEKKVETVQVQPKPVEPAQPSCNAINLSLFDVQAMARNPSMRFVDTRTEAQFAAGSIPGAVNIPVADFENAFARVSATLNTGAGIILFGGDSMDESPRQVCILMSGRVSPHIYMFREGWGRWTPQQ